MGRLLFVLSALIVLAILWQDTSAQYAGRRRPKKKPWGRNKEGNGNNQLFNALVINYPLHIFDPSSRDWRGGATYSPEFDHQSTTDRGYLDFTRAQDQEDVWLYENWFYGMKNGVIMESGALDGILYSNSLMFESYANWTAIHVGKCHCNIFGMINLFIYHLAPSRGRPRELWTAEVKP